MHHNILFLIIKTWVSWSWHLDWDLCLIIQTHLCLNSVAFKVVVLRSWFFHLANKLLGGNGCTLLRQDLIIKLITIGYTQIYDQDYTYCRNNIYSTSLFHWSYSPQDFVLTWHQECIFTWWPWWGCLHGATAWICCLQGVVWYGMSSMPVPIWSKVWAFS